MFVTIALSVPILGSTPLITLEAAFSNNQTQAPLSGTYRVNVSIRSLSVPTSRSISNLLGLTHWTESFNYTFNSDGIFYCQAGSVVPIPPAVFAEPNLTFIVEVVGVGETAIPIFHLPLSAYAELAGEALMIKPEAIKGMILPANMVGVYGGITGVGELTTPLSVNANTTVGSIFKVDTSAQRVGIGTTAPQSAFDVASTSTFRGNVGIGMTNPQSALDVSGISTFRGNVGIGVMTPQTALDVANVASFRNNVGIGTTTPVAALDVAGSGVIRSMLGVGVSNPEQTLDVGGNIRFRSGMLVFPDGTTMNTALKMSDVSSGTVAQSGTSQGILSNKSVLIQANGTPTASVVFRFSGNDRMVITSFGQVGIGKTNPSQPLDINGAIKIGSGSSDTLSPSAGTIRYLADRFEGYNGSTWMRLDVIPSADNWVLNPTQRTLSLSQDGATRVGIGTSSPETELEVLGTIKSTALSGNGMGITSLNAAQLVGAVSVKNGGTGISQPSNNGILFYNATLDRMAQLSIPSGSVLLGRTNGVLGTGNLVAGAGISLNIVGNTIQIAHASQGAQPSFTLPEGSMLSGLSMDAWGHVTGYQSLNLDDRYLSPVQGDARFLLQKGGVLTGALVLAKGVAIGSTSDIQIATGSTKVGIGVAQPVQRLDINGAIRIGDTTLNSPGSIRYNTDTGRFEGFNGSMTWVELDVPRGQEVGLALSGTDITLKSPVFKLGLGMEPTERLSVAGNIYVSDQVSLGGRLLMQPGQSISFASGGIGTLSADDVVVNARTVSLPATTIQTQAGNALQVVGYPKQRPTPPFG
ncbi:hypothetical protein EBZ35_02020 [bacterium]|nr:hypothetical protein [bacterium]